MLMWLREICSGVRGNSGAGRRRGIGLHGEAAWFEDLGDPEAVFTDVKLLLAGGQVDLCLDREEENTALDWDKLVIHLPGRVLSCSISSSLGETDHLDVPHDAVQVVLLHHGHPGHLDLAGNHDLSTHDGVSDRSGVETIEDLVSDPVSDDLAAQLGPGSDHDDESDRSGVESVEDLVINPGSDDQVTQLGPGDGLVMIPIVRVKRIFTTTFLPSVSPILPIVAGPGAGGRIRRILAVGRLGLLHVDLVLEVNLELVRLLLQPLADGQDLLKISSSLGSVVSYRTCTYFYVQNCRNTSGWVELGELNPNISFRQQTQSWVYFVGSRNNYIQY